MPQIPYCAHRIVDDALHQIRNRNVADVVTLVKYLQGVLPPRDRSLNAAGHKMPVNPDLTAAIRDSMRLRSPKVRDILSDYYTTGDIDMICRTHAISPEYLSVLRRRMRSEVEGIIKPAAPSVVNQTLSASQ